MKIALVSPYDINYPGGVTRHVTHFADFLAKKGHFVKIIAPCSNESQKRHDVISIGKPIPIPKAGSVGRISISLWNWPRVAWILHHYKFDVIHIHEPEVPFLPIAVLAHAKPDKNLIIGTFHASRQPTFSDKFYTMLTKTSGVANWMKKLNGKIAVSNSAKDFIVNFWPGSYKIIPNAIDTDRFSPKVQPIDKFIDGKLNILFVGRLGNNETRKGLRYLIKAYESIAHQVPNSRLIIAGPGKVDDESRIELERLHNADVVFTGRISDEDLPRYYKTADIFCAPSLGGESFGIVLAEAMACAKPIVASEIDGYVQVMRGDLQIREISKVPVSTHAGADSLMTTTDAGIMVPPGDSESLARALVTLANQKQLRDAMGDRGRKIVEDNFSWDIVGIKVLNFYQRKLAAKARYERRFKRK